MNHQRPTSQSPTAKKAWSDIPRPNPSLFNFDLFPALLDFVHQNSATSSVVLVVGGGRGELARRMVAAGKLAFNFDVDTTLRDPLTPTIWCDMEVGIPYERKDGGPHAVLTPFSLEYTNARISTGKIADVLLPGEHFVWVCHHSDSFIINDFRKARRFAPIASSVFAHAVSTGTDSWLVIAKKSEPSIREIFEFDKFNIPSPLDCPLDSLLSRLPTLLKWANTGMRQANAMLLLATLRLGYERVSGLHQCLFTLSKIAGNFNIDLEISSFLLTQNLRCPADMVDVVDPRLRLQSHLDVRDAVMPLALLASFERV